MFRLKLPTDPRWANIAEGNLEEILTDHAWCELKAASNAIMLINMLPEFTEITTELTKIAKEEMDHFEQVHEIIKARGWVLGRERKDSYVNDLFKFMKPGNRKHLIVERMLFAAMIEARSCERFKVLSDNIKSSGFLMTRAVQPSSRHRRSSVMRVGRSSAVSSGCIAGFGWAGEGAGF